MDIHLDRICKAYGENHVLRDFSYSFPDGSATCILGASGRGKTTLLRLIADLEAPDSGTITGIDGKNTEISLRELSARATASPVRYSCAMKKISAVFQEDRLIENLTVEKNVMLTARPGFTRQDARMLLGELGLEDAANQQAKTLSGGMKRRTAIARALAADYDLLLLDEPFGGLDEDTHSMALEVIRRHSAGRTLICVTHDEADALRLDAGILRL